MHTNVVDSICPTKFKSIFGAFTPGRIVRERRDHFDVVAVALQKFTKGDVVRGDAGDLRRVIDPPNNDPHLCQCDANSTGKTSVSPLFEGRGLR